MGKWGDSSSNWACFEDGRRENSVSSSKWGAFEDGSGKNGKSSSNQADFEDEMGVLGQSSSNQAGFEDGGSGGGRCIASSSTKRARFVDERQRQSPREGVATLGSSEGGARRIRVIAKR